MKVKVRKSLEIRQKAVQDYRRGDRIEAIAQRYGVTVGAISTWAKNANVKRRTQGCRVKDRPNPRELEIVAAMLAKHNGRPTFDEVGKQFGMPRQGVHRIFHRWKHWVRGAPFKKGDHVRFQGRDYEVLKPDTSEGKVRDLKNGEVTRISWRIGKDWAVKL